MDAAIGDSPQTTVVDVTDADFGAAVLEESHRRPVVVDFWAAWCGPCRQLGPVLERVAEERAGDFLLAKVDVDANPYTSSQFRIQSIPSVWAFSGGRPVDQFVGALPEPSVRQWIERLLPSQSEREARAAAEAERAGDVEVAERQYREVLVDDPSNRDARVGLARILAERGEKEEARELLKPLLADPEAERLMATIRVGEWSESLDPSDDLAAAKRFATEGRWSEALDGLLGAVRYSPELRDDARAAMIDVFAVLGDEDPLTREYRGKLASALF